MSGKSFLTSAQHELDRVRLKQIMRVNALAFYAASVIVRFKKTKFGKWRHELDQIDVTNGLLCANV